MIVAYLAPCSGIPRDPDRFRRDSWWSATRHTYQTAPSKYPWSIIGIFTLYLRLTTHFTSSKYYKSFDVYLEQTFKLGGAGEQQYCNEVAVQGHPNINYVTLYCLNLRCILNHVPMVILSLHAVSSLCSSKYEPDHASKWMLTGMVLYHRPKCAVIASFTCSFM